MQVELHAAAKSQLSKEEEMHLVTLTASLLIVAYTVFDKSNVLNGKDLPEAFTDAVPNESAGKY